MPGGLLSLGRGCLACLFALLVVSACSTLTPTQRFRLTDEAFSLPSDPDLRPFVVEVEVGSGEPLPFLIDTGSTVTALYPRGAGAAGVDGANSRLVDIRGISGIEQRPEIFIPSLTFGPRTYQDKRAVLLEPNVTNRQLAGIIGLDILSDFAFLWDPITSTFSFVPTNDFRPKLFSGWVSMPLEKTAPNIEPTSLLFGSTLLRRDRVPVLIDTGADQSFINWDIASRSLILRLQRRRLRERWEVAGSIGTFSPETSVRIPNFKFGPQPWDNPTFVVTPLPAFEAPNAEEAPLMILGSNYFASRRFLIDPATSQLFLEVPRPDRDRLTVQPNTVIRRVADPEDML